MTRLPSPSLGGVALGLSVVLAGCWGKTNSVTDPTCSITAVSIAPGQLSLVLGGETGTLTATVTSTNCTTAPTILWSSSNATAVSISGSGSSITLTALAGSAAPVVVTATTEGASATAQITIISEPVIGVASTAVGFASTMGGVTSQTRTVTISNAGGGTLSGLAIGPIAYGAGASGWLQATLSGTAAIPTATLNLQVQTGALQPGSYEATVPLTSSAAANSPVNLLVVVQVHPQPSGVPTVVFERWIGPTYPSPTGEIWRMDPNGTNQVQLTDNTTFDGYPQLSPDRTRIAFSTSRMGNHDLYTMNADGTGQTGLRFSPVPELSSSWSPDGLRLAYELLFSATDMNLRLYTPGNDVDLPFVATAQSEENPSWSPDGLEIAFAKDPLGTFAYKIYRSPVAGGAPTQLTFGSSDDFSPAWSPDGTRIAFASNRVDGNYNIFVMDAATGNNIVQLTTVGTNFGAAWSPDGTKIAFASGQGTDWDIWVINADGTGLMNITATPGTNEIGPSWR